MDVADACPTEDFIAALLEYLVEPKLQGESSSKGDISQIAQESIAKQVHAVVLLYNYYHRKQYPQLEFLCFESFCKLAVVIKPGLMAHIRLLQRSNDTESQPFPLLEESIMEACSVKAANQQDSNGSMQTVTDPYKAANPQSMQQVNQRKDQLNYEEEEEDNSPTIKRKDHVLKAAASNAPATNPPLSPPLPYSLLSNGNIKFPFL